MPEIKVKVVKQLKEDLSRDALDEKLSDSKGENKFSLTKKKILKRIIWLIAIVVFCLLFFFWLTKLLKIELGRVKEEDTLLKNLKQTILQIRKNGLKSRRTIEEILKK